MVIISLEQVRAQLGEPYVGTLGAGVLYYNYLDSKTRIWIDYTKYLSLCIDFGD